MLHQRYAQAICDAHEIDSLMSDSEERELLIANNQDLYYAYIALLQVAYPEDERWYI